MKKMLAILTATVMLMTMGFGLTASAEDISGTVTMWSFPLSADDAALFAPIVEALTPSIPT